MKKALTAHVLTCAFFLGACDDEPVEEERPAPVEAPNAPDSMSGHFCFETEALGGFRDAIDTAALSAMIPSSAGAFLAAQFEESPAATSAVNDDSRVCGLFLEDEVIFAAELAPTSPHPAGAWHEGAAHFGTIGVFGERAHVEAGGAYLSQVVFAEDLDAPITLRALDGVFAERLRPVLDRALREASANARSAARAEQEAQAEEADFGDPQAFVRVAERRLGALIQWVPDLGAVLLELRVQGGAIHVDVAFEVHEGSPLRAFLDGAATQENAFDRLPRGTAFAYSRASEGESVVGALLEIAGQRANQDEARALLAVAEQMQAPFTFALGTTGQPWLEYSGAVSPETSSLLAGNYIRTLTSALFACPRPPREWPREETNTSRCRLPGLEVSPSRLSLGDVPREVVGASPDVARLAAGSPRILGGVYVDVLRLPAALSLFTALETRELRRDEAAPILGTLHYEGGTLHGRLRAAPGSIANVADVVMSLIL